MKTRRLTASVGFITWLCVFPASGQNIIDQTYGIGAGSFELGNFVDNGQGYMPLAAGSTAITGWMVGGPGGGVKLLGPASSKSIDLTLGTQGSIFTTVPTVPGCFYTLSFDLAPYPLGGRRSVKKVKPAPWAGY